LTLGGTLDLSSPPAIGGTAAAAGAFTTLAASGAVTLSGGTANGVTYLNGSKVLTSGSALVFDGTNLGVSVTPSTWSTGSALETNAKGNAIWGVGSSNINVLSNAYYNAGYLYASTGAASNYQQASGAHKWLTVASGTIGTAITFTQAMTLDASGNLLVGTTNASDSAGVGFKLNVDAAHPIMAVVGSSSTNAFDTYHLYSTGASAYRFYVGFGGTVYATSTTITAISDQRLKENIRDLDEGLATVMALKPRKFDWKEGKGQNIKNARGFIAQEFETVLPDMIEEWRDPAPEGEEAYKAINANLIPTLVKAIQEQQALIQSLTARLDAANL
jgi:hypothetical protein